MSEFVNSVTEAQQKLHADMRRDEDPRWHLLPVESVKPPRGFWRFFFAIQAASFAVAIILVATGVLS